jgi:uncharacterized protein
LSKQEQPDLPEQERQSMAARVTITGLFFYPIKSCAGTAAREAVLDAQGIRYDRRWMVVRAADNRFLTQREYPQMAVIRPAVTADGLTLETPGLPPLVLPFAPDAALQRRNATVWGFTGETLDEGDDAADWFSEALGLSCRLVRTPEDFTRRVARDYAGPDDRVGFADAFPFLLTAEKSLADLNARLAVPLPMDRFRPNIVVAGAPAFAEDTWRTLRVGANGAVFRVAKPCARCATTTIHQATGEKDGPEPLATLARFRRTADNKVLFGMNLVHEWRGEPIVLRVGDTAEAE